MDLRDRPAQDHRQPVGRRQHAPHRGDHLGAAIEHYRELEQTVRGLADELGVKADRVAATVAKLAAERKELEKKLKAAESGEVRGRLDDVLASLPSVGGVPVVAAQPAGRGGRRPADARRRGPRASAGRGRRARRRVDGRAAIVVAVSDAAVGRGVHARRSCKAMLPAVDGKGGGKPNLARGAAPTSTGIDAALDAGLAKVRELLGA